jgi:phospholipase C
MHRAEPWGVVLAVLFLAIFEVGCGGAGSRNNSSNNDNGGQQPPQGTPAPASITHIVVMMQENRSFDNYFGRLGQYKRDHGIPGDVEDLPLNVTVFARSGAPVQPFHLRTVCHENISPSWNQSHFYWDHGKMDLFMHTATKSTIDPDTTRAMGYYDWTDLPYYYELASQYATSDRFFSSVMTETVPNRLYMMGATSWGATKAIGPFPRQYTLIWDHLNDAGVSWKYYVPSASKVPFIEQFPGGAARYGSHVVPIAQYFSDLHSDSTFPQVAFIERQEGFDEHPANNIQIGSAKAKTYIDALMKSPAWGTSVFILDFDEGGGMYDHVPPVPVPAPDNIAPDLGPQDFQAGFDMTGFRVPFILVSPLAKPNFVSHVPRDHTSILALIESTFKVQPLTARDAAADKMSEFFDFNAAPRTAIPNLPDQPKNGVCDFTQEVAPGH